MGSTMFEDSTISLSCLVTILLFLLSNVPCQAHLSPSFYDSTCPNVFSTIRSAVQKAVEQDHRMAASLLRLHFHDCFVQGCDASLLLDDGPSITSEKFARQNFQSLRGFEAIDEIKSKVESVCPGVVSCADLLAIVARDATVIAGGPTWTVKLGRRDSTTASKDLAEASLPTDTATLDQQISIFKSKGLDERDLVALTGSHTIGQSVCATARYRLYNDSDIDEGFKIMRQRNCPLIGGDGNLAPIDLVTPEVFDTYFFKNLIERKGLLYSDQVLYGGSTAKLVVEYSQNPEAFFSDFAAGMVKMGDISPLTGSSGQIRRDCRVPN